MKQIVYIVIIAFIIFLNGCSSQGEVIVEESSMFSEMRVDEFYKEIGVELLRA